MASDNKEKTKLIVFGIPEELKIQFKLQCVERKVSMSRVLVRLVRSEVEKADGIS